VSIVLGDLRLDISRWSKSNAIRTFSSEMFAKVQAAPQNEKLLFYPRGAYTASMRPEAIATISAARMDPTQGWLIVTL
jgi:GDP-D-mannose dehydratase